MKGQWQVPHIELRWHRQSAQTIEVVRHSNGRWHYETPTAIEHDVLVSATFVRRSGKREPLVGAGLSVTPGMQLMFKGRSWA